METTHTNSNTMRISKVMPASDTSSIHASVLLHEVLESLHITPNGTYVDGTINGGGHASEIAKQLSSAGTLVGIDEDTTGLAVSRQRLAEVKPTIHLVQGNFRAMNEHLKSLDLPNANGILLDLGWSSNQFENPARGFSFRHEGPLLMTLKSDVTENDLTAYDVVNTWQEETLADIIYLYGEERKSRRIAKAIVDARRIAEITTTIQLADIVEAAVGKSKRFGYHPATQTFQALRIVVNDELTALKDGIDQSMASLAPGGRLVIISFHSLEDRIVKDAFRAAEDRGEGKRITKKPVTATQAELRSNPRSRSAKMRVFEKNA